MGHSLHQRARHQKEKRMEDTILTARDLRFRYDPDQPVYALDGVSASVRRGEFVADTPSSA